MAKPKIRFKGYTDDWEQRKFSEGVSEIGDGLHGTPIYCEDGNVYFINGNNLVDGKIVISAETKKVNESQQSTADKSLDDTTILMSINGTIGNLAYYSGERLMLGKSAAYIKVSEFDKRFVYAYLQAPSVQGYFMDSLTGTTIKNLGLKAIREMIMFIPQDVDEQKRIGKFFDYLDHLITLHQCKCHLLLKLLHNDWEQRKLGDILISLQNNTLSRADLSNEAGVAKNVHYGDVLIKFGEVLDVSKEKLPMISDESVLSKYKSSFLQNGDVIVADTAEDFTVGKCSEIAGLNDVVVLSGLHTIPYRPIEKFASGYLGYYLNSSAYHNQLIPLMQGIKVTSISKSAMQDTDIVYPKSVEEQGKIGNYFQSLDHLITLHHRKYIYILKSP